MITIILRCTNLKTDESAIIEYIHILEKYKLYYYVPGNGSHCNLWGRTDIIGHYKTVKGAKIAFSKFMGFKTEWKQVK